MKSILKLNIADVKAKRFNGGEMQITLLPYHSEPTSESIIVKAHIKDSDGIIALCQIKSLLDQHYWDKKVILHMPYVPFARQDRPMEDQDAFSLKVFTNILNSLNFDHVFVKDPHSEVSIALMNNVQALPQHESTMFIALEQKNYDAVVSPDAGALKKIYKAAKRLGVQNIVKSDKVRDTTNGKILSTEVHGDVAGKNLLIIDDILDGGRTYVELAKVLKDKGAKTVDLFITHGIFAFGTSELRQNIDHIYCDQLWTDFIQPEDYDFISRSNLF